MCKNRNDDGTDVWIGYNLDRLGNDSLDRSWIEGYVRGIWWVALFVLLGPERNSTASILRWRRAFVPFIAGLIACLPLVFFVLLSLIIVGGWPLAVATIWPQVLQFTKSDFGYPSLIAISVIGSLVLFWVRKKFQSLYGFAEIIFGAIVIWYGYHEAREALLGDRALDHFKILVAVIGGAYVIVRGADNIDKGREQATQIVRVLRSPPTKTEHRVGPPAASA